MSETAKMLHVNLAPGEAGRYAIVPGDPDRCELIAAHLDNPRICLLYTSPSPRD